MLEITPQNEKLNGNSRFLTLCRMQIQLSIIRISKHPNFENQSLSIHESCSKPADQNQNHVLQNPSLAWSWFLIGHLALYIPASQRSYLDNI